MRLGLCYNMISDSSPNLIEGVGDEVVVTASVLFAFFLIVAATLAKFKRLSTIHPSSQNDINSVRRHLNIIYSNRFFDPTTELSSSDNVSGQIHIDRVQNSQRYGMDSQCPVCLNTPHFPVETNCGHLFCSQCLIVYWRHGHWSSSGPVRCPVCRQQVTVMLSCFRPEGRSGELQENLQLRQQSVRDINEYNRRFSGEPRPWIDYLRDLPTLLRHLSAEFFSLGGLMYMLRIRIVLCFIAAIMYLISPLDMIPEAIFGLLGLLDDIFVVILLAVYVTIIYRRFLANRWVDDDPHGD